MPIEIKYLVKKIINQLVFLLFIILQSLLDSRRRKILNSSQTVVKRLSHDKNHQAHHVQTNIYGTKI